MPGVGTPSVVEPTSGKKTAGWNADERPSFEHFNWLFQNVSDWITYLEGITDTVAGLTKLYDAYVGAVVSGSIATHASLQAVMADSAIGPGARILILEDLTVDTIQQITKNNVEIDFKPGVVYTKGVASSALQISADGVRVRGGRFINFSGVSDAAMKIDTGKKYAMIRDARFNNNTTDVDDQGVGTSEVGNINE